MDCWMFLPLYLSLIVYVLGPFQCTCRVPFSIRAGVPFIVHARSLLLYVPGPFKGTCQVLFTVCAGSLLPLYVLFPFPTLRASSLSEYESGPFQCTCRVPFTVHARSQLPLCDSVHTVFFQLCELGPFLCTVSAMSLLVYVTGTYLYHCTCQVTTPAVHAESLLL